MVCTAIRQYICFKKIKLYFRSKKKSKCIIIIHVTYQGLHDSSLICVNCFIKTDCKIDILYSFCLGLLSEIEILYTF